MVCELTYLQKMLKKTCLQTLARHKNAYMCMYIGIYIYISSYDINIFLKKSATAISQ